MHTTSLHKKHSLAAFFGWRSKQQTTPDPVPETSKTSILPLELTPKPNPADRPKEQHQNDDPLLPPPTITSRWKHLEAALDGKTPQVALPIYEFYTQPERGSTAEIVSRLRRRKASSQLDVAAQLPNSLEAHGGEENVVGGGMEAVDGGKSCGRQ